MPRNVTSGWLLNTIPRLCGLQVAAQIRSSTAVEVEFTGQVFQPVPYSPNTKRGVPAEFEQYLDDPHHVIINIPPNFMFQAKISNPSRLGAVYKHKQPS